MSFLNKLLALLALLAGAFAVFFRLRGKQQQTTAEKATQRAETAEAISDVHRHVDEARTNVQQHHREEQKKIEQTIKDGRRDHLDNNW